MKLLNILVFTLILSVITGCSNDTSVKPNSDMPDDFNFSLTYGTYGKQKIDTFNDIVVKDLVVDGTVEAKISLTEEEMNQIYQEMLNINIMGELDLNKDEECVTEPPSLSKWNIQIDGETKTFNYSTYCDLPKDGRKLLKLEDFIHSIIIEKDEYKKLPKVNGAYE